MSMALQPSTIMADSAKTLDQRSIHQRYNEADFDAVIQTLEAFRKSHPACSRSDSIFIAKHLAVVYTANPATREKGRYFMYMLLDLLPSAKLVDMYVGEEIDRIFDKVREEFMARQHAFGVDTARIVMPPRRAADTNRTTTADPRPDSAKPRSGLAFLGKRQIWIPGSVAGAALLGTGVYFLLSPARSGSDSPPRRKMDVLITTPPQ